MPTGLWLYAYLGLWVLLLVETVVISALIRHIASLNAHYIKNDPDAGLPLGVLAPALIGEDIFGRPVSLSASRGRKTLIYFLSTGCPSCREVMGRSYRLAAFNGVDLVVAVTANKTRAELFAMEFWRGNKPEHFAVLPDRHKDNYNNYQVSLVPYAVVVDEDGRIGAKGSAVGFAEVAHMIQQAEQLRLRRHNQARERELVVAG